MGEVLDLVELASRLGRLEARCGPVRLVAVDGHAGSGKSTFAARLAEALDDAPVLHLDDLASHDALFEWTARFRTTVAEPLSEGRTARFHGYDWRRRAFLRASALPPRPVVLVEGVGSGRRALRPWLSAVLWMDLPRSASWERGIRRDGPEQEAFWRGWRRAETRHFTVDPSRPYAHFLVREHGVGWVVRDGPAGGFRGSGDSHSG